jgi:hypothetical protein
MEELEKKLLRDTAIKVGITTVVIAAGIFYITSDYLYGQEAIKLKKEITKTQQQITKIDTTTSPVEYLIMQEKLAKTLVDYSDKTYPNRQGSLEQALYLLQKELRSSIIKLDVYECARINEQIADTYKKMWDNSENPINLFVKMGASLKGTINALDECLKTYTPEKFPQDHARIQQKRKEAQQKYERIFKQTI